MSNDNPSNPRVGNRTDRSPDAQSNPSRIAQFKQAVRSAINSVVGGSVSIPSLPLSRPADRRSPGESTRFSLAWLVPWSGVSEGGETETSAPDGGQVTRDRERDDRLDRRGSVASGGFDREFDPEAPVCDYCGLPIDYAGQRCPARDAGRCLP
jgi:hypothetical protein